jgi:glycosyltransferase involved in cell wall biosynthesis
VERRFVRDVSSKLRNLARPRIRRLARDLWVVDPPPAVPFGAHLAGAAAPALAKAATTVNNAVLARCIRRAMACLGVRAPILWLYHPWHVGLVGRFGEKLVCYHVHDEIADYPSNRPIRAYIEACDRLLSRKADLIFASSSAQAARRRPLNEHTHFVPNAVDFDHFNKALDPGLELPADVRQIPRPRVGYVGFLGFQIDVALLLTIALSRPDWHLVLVGPDCLGKGEQCGRLRCCPNVHFLGQKPVHDLPAYLKALDVALMPYDLTTHVSTSYPLKLHEYLAAGKAVVAVPLPELTPFQDLLYLAVSPDQFMRCVDRALVEKPGAMVDQRMAAARQNTWDQRVEQVTALIRARLAGHPPQE